MTSLVLSGAACEAIAGERYALMGVGGGPGGILPGAFGGDSSDGLHAFAGLIYAPGHSLSDAGWLVRGWAKSFEFTYKTDLPDKPETRIRALGYQFQAEAGWQIAGRWGRAAILPGLAWRNHSLTPSDPGSSLEKGRVNVTLTADAEWRFNDRFGVMANAAFMTGFDEYWTQARPFIHLGDGWKAGLDFAGYGGPGYARVRAGAFTTGYELPFTAFGRLFVGAEAGVQSDLDGKRVSPFAGLHVGLLF